VRDALSVLVAVVNQNVNRCRHTGNLEVHAPATTRICAPGADLISVVSANCDRKGVGGLMRVDPIAQVPCVTRADDRNRRRDALFVAVAVVDEDMDGRPGNCNNATAELGILSSMIVAKLLRKDVVSARHTTQTFVLAAEYVSVVATSVEHFVRPPNLSVILSPAHPQCQRVVKV
jgi:hypothetical protein